MVSNTDRQISAGDPDRRQLTVEVLHSKADDWVWGCKETETKGGVRRCLSAENLSGRSVLLPSKGNRKMVDLNLEELGELYSDIVINLQESEDRTRVNIDLYNPRERSIREGLIVLTSVSIILLSFG